MKNLLRLILLASLYLVASSNKSANIDYASDVVGHYRLSRLEQNGTVVTFPTEDATGLLSIYKKTPNTVDVRFRLLASGKLEMDESIEDLIVERNTYNRYSLTVDGQPVGTITGRQLIIDVSSGERRGTWVANRR